MSGDIVDRFVSFWGGPPSRLDWLMALLALSLLSGCATTSYAELDQCPAVMDEEQKASGVVRCRAMCSSYNRDFDSFGDDCHCNCASKVGSSYRPQQHRRKAPITGQM